MTAKITEKNFGSFTWSDLHLPSSDDVLKAAESFDIAPLQVADSVQPGHLPKYEKDDLYTFILLRGLTPDFVDLKSTDLRALSDKIAIFYNDTKVITIHGGEFHFLHTHVGEQYGGPHSLVLNIIQSTLRTFDEPAVNLRKNAEDLESKIFLENTSKVSLKNIYFQKTHARIAKNILLMNQDVLKCVSIENSLHSVFQDLREELGHSVSTYTELHENANNILSAYLSINEQKNNDVVRVLTIFSAFFLPLTFIVGVYGMNFKVFPELDWYYGYPVSMAIMFGVCIGIYVWFKKKGFL